MQSNIVQEAKENVINLDDDEIEHVELMLDYLYTSDYTEFDQSITLPTSPTSTFGMVTTESPEPREHRFSAKMSISEKPGTPPIVQGQLRNVFVYAIAEKYNIKALKDLAIAKFTSHLWKSWESHFSDIVSSIYTTTPSSDKGLRDTVCVMCVNHRKDVNILTDEELDALYHQFPDFKGDLLSKYISEILSPIGERVKATESKFLELKDEFERVKGRLDKFETTMTKYRHSQCPSCGRFFQTHGISYDPSENDSGSTTVILRCSSCRRAL